MLDRPFFWLTVGQQRGTLLSDALELCRLDFPIPKPWLICGIKAFGCHI
jgi:hypothetical protein